MKGKGNMLVCDKCKDLSKRGKKVTFRFGLHSDRKPKEPGMIAYDIMAGNAPEFDLCDECAEEVGKELINILKKAAGK